MRFGSRLDFSAFLSWSRGGAPNKVSCRCVFRPMRVVVTSLLTNGSVGLCCCCPPQLCGPKNSCGVYRVVREQCPSLAGWSWSSKLICTMPTINSSSKDSPSLPPKENALFKRILKCYELKQYKNGLKFAKQILSNPKYADHGETLAMKGLTLNCLGRKEDAYEHVRRGLRNALKSHVCWHVYGLLQRSDKKYDEAIKCYRNALKWDRDNIQILRDLSLLQIQMRDLDGYKETRYQLFQLRPTQRASWIGFAMAHHLLRDHEMALKILEEFRKTQQKTVYDYEHSELLLYQNLVVRESGDTQRALDHLERYKEQICDQTHFLEVRGDLLLSLEQYEEASLVFESLIERNPENHAYYRQRERAARVDDNMDAKLELYQGFKNKYPKATAPQRLPLDIATGEAFQSLLAPYLKKALRKGMPPLFVDIRPLYKDKNKASLIESLCKEYLDLLKAGKSMDDTCNSEKDEEVTKEPATALLWLLYFLAQHYDYFGQHEKALSTVEEAIEHTPTLIELFLLKGKILKHLGDLEGAVACVDEAQSLDTADRYLNFKCAKYLLHAGRSVKEVESMCSKFTRDGVNAMDSLNEMQCMHFQTECAMAFAEKGLRGEAIKKCIEVDRHFTEIVEDQFDFHTYCMRKMTLRSYVDLLRLEDKLRSHDFYERAAHTAIDVYLSIFDKPDKNDEEIDDLPNSAGLDASELRKLRNKQRKARRKAEQQAELAKSHGPNRSNKKTNDNSNNEDTSNSNNSSDHHKDDQQQQALIPDRLSRPDDPLLEAIKFLLPLQNLASQRLKTHLYAFEIYWRRQRPLLMLQSLKRASAIAEQGREEDKDDIIELHSCVVRMQRHMETRMQDLNDSVQSVLKQETKEIWDAKTDSLARNEAFLKDNEASLKHVFAGAKMMVWLQPDQSSRALDLIAKPHEYRSGVTLKVCESIVESLRNGVFGEAGQSICSSFELEASKIFSRAKAFKKYESNKTEEKTSNSESVINHNHNNISEP